MLIIINWFAVLVAGVASMGIGSLWYSPLLFGKKWMKLRGESAVEMSRKAFPLPEMMVQFTASMVTAFFVAEFAAWMSTSGVLMGLLLGFWVWLGFYATTMLRDVLWNGGSWSLYVLDAMQYLVSLLVMGAIIGVWR